MSLAIFERLFDRIAPALWLSLGFASAAAFATVGA
jgi:hypothetical protein